MATHLRHGDGFKDTGCSTVYDSGIVVNFSSTKAQAFYARDSYYSEVTRGNH